MSLTSVKEPQELLVFKAGLPSSRLLALRPLWVLGKHREKEMNNWEKHAFRWHLL